MTHSTGLNKYYENRMSVLLGGKVINLIEDGEFIGIQVEKNGKIFNVWFSSDEEANDGGVPIIEAQ